MAKLTAQQKVAKLKSQLKDAMGDPEYVQLLEGTKLQRKAARNINIARVALNKEAKLFHEQLIGGDEKPDQKWCDDYVNACAAYSDQVSEAYQLLFPDS